MRHRFRWLDLWALGLFPIYAMLQTLAHVGSIALVAWARGATVIDLVFYPTFTDGFQFHPHVLLAGATSDSRAVPYIANLVLLTIGLLALRVYRLRFHVPWVLVVYVFLFSPYADVTVNYACALIDHFDVDLPILTDVLPVRTDVHSLIGSFGAAPVHIAFIGAIAVYGFLIWRVLRGSPGGDSDTASE